MYLVKVEVKESIINGKGVFSLEEISKGKIVWKFDPLHDKTLSVQEFNELDQTEKSELKRVAYLSTSSGLYVYPPEGDPALFTNHSKDHNLSVLIDKVISEEPYFIANRDIHTGEELTNNYSEFDESLKKVKLDWI